MQTAGINGAVTQQQIFDSECEIELKGKPPGERSITAKGIRALLEEQQYCCALTGAALTPKTASIDHKTPLSRGGKHCISNAQVILDYVNTAKGCMTNEEFVSMCRQVSAFSGS